MLEKDCLHHINLYVIEDHESQINSRFKLNADINRILESNN